MPFRALSCKSCTASSIETYYYTIRSLAKLAGLQDVPLDHKWINDKLYERVKLTPKTTSSKNLAVAALKALRAYTQTEAVKKKLEKWGKYVSKVTEKYSQARNKQERTKCIAAPWAISLRRAAASSSPLSWLVVLRTLSI